MEEKSPPNHSPPYPSPCEKTGTRKDLNCRDRLCLHPVTPKPPPFLPSIPPWVSPGSEMLPVPPTLAGTRQLS